MCLLLPIINDKLLASLNSLIQIVMLDMRGKVCHKYLTCIFIKKVFLMKETSEG